MKLIAALVLAAIAAGCGGGGDGGGGDGRPGGDPVPSAGCGASQVGAGGDRIELTSGGVDRWYLREVPAVHDGERPVPVVVDLHGYGEGAEAHVASTELGPYGAVAGFVTVTPQGQGEVASWDTAQDSPDIAFVEDVLDDIERSLCVDTDRVFVVGSSNGAMLAARLACEASDRIAAVATVAGAGVVDSCRPDRPVPVVAFHGTRDSKIRYGGGLDPGVAALPLAGGSRTIGDLRSGADLSIPDVMAWWASGQGCGTSPERHQVSPDTVRMRFPCPGWTAVELYRIEGGGHTWPGRDVDASGAGAAGARPGPGSPTAANDLIWQFLETHSLSVTPSWDTLSPP